MISKVRRDLEELVSLIPGNDSAYQVEPLAASASVANEVPEVERIILYIDDLDRCPADKVIEVLQAVHLLLAFKLFVVVVGVDHRWLRRSLKRHYGTLLDEPNDYLEKIFQIPFAVKPMAPNIYQQLVNELASNRTQDSSGVAGCGQHKHRGDEAGAARSGNVSDVITPARSDTRDDLEPPKPEGLLISDVEVRLLGRVGGLVPTPRATKRLVNIYRMLRASVPTDEADDFVRGDMAITKPSSSCSRLSLGCRLLLADFSAKLKLLVMKIRFGTRWIVFPALVRVLPTCASM